MKRIAIIVLSGLILAGTLSAQAVQPATTAASTATVTKAEGKLALVNGLIAIQANSKTYYLGGLQHLIGFIDGLKEGASVKVEGYAMAINAAPEYIHLRLTKLTFNGKDYDLSQVGGRGQGGFGGMMGRGMGQGFDDQAGSPGQGMMGGRGRR